MALSEPPRRQDIAPTVVQAERRGLMRVDPATPVLVGIGTVVQKFDEPGEGLDDSAMIVEAARRALVDSGSRSLQTRVGWIGATRGLVDIGDVGRSVGRELGVEAHTVSAAIGIPQQTVINRAIAGIVSGSIEAAVVCGGEAHRRAGIARRAGVELTAPNTAGSKSGPDENWMPSGEIVAQPEVEVRAVSPVQQYAMIDNARRAAMGWSIGDHLDDIAELWHRLNVVAGTNPLAAFPQPRNRLSIRNSSPENRSLAFPYNKWHSSQWSVDQSAALVLCSAAVASECGVPMDRWIFPHIGLESSHSLSLSRRRNLAGWPAMNVLGSAASSHLGSPVSEIEHMEIYSCFPSAVRVQQNELGIHPDRASTITGGMPFAGGPFNSFVFVATAAMARRLRADPGSFGMVTGVSGLLTKPALAVWSARPPANGVLVADLVAEAAAATREVPLDETPDGVGTVATYTVVPADIEPARVCAIVDLDDGARAVAAVADDDLARSAMTEDLIGRRVSVNGIDLSV